MFSIILDINDEVVGKIGVWNRQEHDWREPGVVVTRYSVYDMTSVDDADYIEEYDHLFDVWHNRNDGASDLGSKVLDALDEEVLYE